MKKNAFFIIAICALVIAYVPNASSHDVCPKKLSDIKKDQNFIKSDTAENSYIKPVGSLASCDYRDEGTLLNETQYIMSGSEALLHGFMKYYYENGNIKLLTPYNNGKREGVEKYYDELGFLDAEVTYKNDFMDLESVKKYYPEYLIRAEIPYQNECPRHIYGMLAESKSGQATFIKDTVDHSVFKKNEFECWYDTDLKTLYWEESAKKMPAIAKTWGYLVEQSEINKKSVKHGSTKLYAYGNLIRISQFKDGVLSGIEKRFHDNGKLESEVQYANDKANGSGKFYFDNGKLRQELTIKDNIVVGDVKKYRIDGSLLATAIVENNKPISGICYHTDGRKRPLTESEIERVSRMDFDCD